MLANWFRALGRAFTSNPVSRSIGRWLQRAGAREAHVQRRVQQELSAGKIKQYLDQQSDETGNAFLFLLNAALDRLQRELGAEGRDLRKIVVDSIRSGATPTDVAEFLRQVVETTGLSADQIPELEELAKLLEAVENRRGQEAEGGYSGETLTPDFDPTPVQPGQRPEPQPTQPGQRTVPPRRPLPPDQRRGPQFAPPGVPPKPFELAPGVQFERAQSSNVYSFGYDPATETLYVRYKAPVLNRQAVKLLGGGRAKGILGRTVKGKADQAGPLYAYFNVHPRVYESMRKANSKGKFVWDHLRVRGSVWRHQYAYRLIDTGLAAGVQIEYAPRQATRGGFVPRTLRMGSGRVVKSVLPREKRRLR